jgi:hypothetical protein
MDGLGSPNRAIDVGTEGRSVCELEGELPAIGTAIIHLAGCIRVSLIPNPTDGDFRPRLSFLKAWVRHEIFPNLNFLQLVGKNPQLSAKTYETEKWDEKQNFLQYNPYLLS